MSKDSNVYLNDILKAINKTERYTKGQSKENFLKNELIIDAVVRNLEIIGESAKKVSEDLKKKSEAIEWKKIAGLRDILAHKYDEINLDIVWDIIENKLPPLKSQINDILK